MGKYEWKTYGFSLLSASIVIDTERWLEKTSGIKKSSEKKEENVDKCVTISISTPGRFAIIAAATMLSECYLRLEQQKSD